MVKPSNDSTEPDWRNEPWASREAKAKEKPYKKGDTWKRSVTTERRSFEKDPAAYIKDLYKQDLKNCVEIAEGIQSGHIVVAARSGDPVLAGMQKIIDRMANACGRFEKPPRLLIHSYRSTGFDDAGKRDANAQVRLAGFIEMNKFAKNYFLQHQEEYKAIMAHELGHIANGDLDAANVARSSTMPPNQTSEVLADRMGAIIHGNPRKYARVRSEYRFQYIKEDNARPYKYWNEYLSPNASARMLYKWADILEREGATDEKGNVIMKKALAIYQRSAEHAEAMLGLDMHYHDKLQQLQAATSR